MIAKALMHPLFQGPFRMKVLRVLQRLVTTSRILYKEPQILLRVPGYVYRSIREGPSATLTRLKRITNPWRYSVDYKGWQAEYSTSFAEKNSMKAWAKELHDPPKIAVVMPVFNPNPEWLQSSIDSVINQIYPHWELCIADDCSTNPEISQILKSALNKDNRIRVVFRKTNGHICACSNSALKLVTFPWLALLDHDDVLPDDALIWVAKAIKDNSTAKLFYSDEDKLLPNGDLSDPYFKPDWNPILMEAQNTFSHLGVYSTELVKSLNGFREGFEGSQDHDLIFRCSEKVLREQIIHIPRVLYHWRVHPDSTASGRDAKPYSTSASQRAISEHLERLSLPLKKVCWEPSVCGFRAEFFLPNDVPKVSIIIPTRNGLKLLKACLNSLFERTDYSNLQVIVIDNGSDDLQTLNYLAGLENQDKIEIIRDPQPFNYSALNNAAVQKSTGDFICLLNNDIKVLEPKWLDVMVMQALRPHVGAVGARLIYPDYTIQHAGVLLGLLGVAGHSHHRIIADSPGYYGRALLAQEISAVTAACLLVSRSNYIAVGGLNEENLSVAYNDIDFCLKLGEMGLRNIYEPKALLMHEESASRGLDIYPQDQERFVGETNWMKESWGEKLLNDPAYNPNLSLDSSHFHLSWPPRVNRWPVDA